MGEDFVQMSLSAGIQERFNGVLVGEWDGLRGSRCGFFKIG